MLRNVIQSLGSYMRQRVISLTYTCRTLSAACLILSTIINTARATTLNNTTALPKVSIIAVLVVPAKPGRRNLDDKGLTQMATKTSNSRGQELRKALEDAYNELTSSNKLRSGFHGTDVSKVVLQYIPIGTQFAEAETLLRNAGFVVEPRPSITDASNPNRSKDWYGVVASIPNFKERLFQRTSIYISILPKSPGDYTDIAHLSATFFISSP